MKQFVQQYVSPEQWVLLEQYMQLLTSENTRVNLVSRKDIENLLENHIAPCLAFAVLGRIQSGEHILDIGSGGGLPGIVNAILFPDSEFVLVDSTKKKCDAIKRMVEALGLENVHIEWSRVDELQKKEEYLESFSRTTSRAVAPLNDLVRWSKPFLEPGGTIEALKGGDLSEEIATVHATWPKATITETPLPADWQQTEKLHTAKIITVELA